MLSLRRQFTSQAVVLVMWKIEHGCPSVRRDNPRALASGLSTVKADTPCSISLVARYPV